LSPDTVATNGGFIRRLENSTVIKDYGCFYVGETAISDCNEPFHQDLFRRAEFWKMAAVGA